jgi:hypothetical protein
MGNKNKLPDIFTKEELMKLFEAMFTQVCYSLFCGLNVWLKSS